MVEMKCIVWILVWCTHGRCKSNAKMNDLRCMVMIWMWVMQILKEHTWVFLLHCSFLNSRWCTDLVCWERWSLCQKKIYGPNHILEKVWFGFQHLNLGSCKLKLDLCILSLNFCNLFILKIEICNMVESFLLEKEFD